MQIILTQGMVNTYWHSDLSDHSACPDMPRSDPTIEEKEVEVALFLSEVVIVSLDLSFVLFLSVLHGSSVHSNPVANP